MTEKLKKVFGIDLGTTYSCISYVDENNKAVIVPNAEGERITPSVVYFEEGGDNIIVGEAAKEISKMYPENVVSFVKRSMGDPNFVFPYEGKDYRSEEISARILTKLVNDAQEALGEKIEDVVITCPAYFGINEREATKRAGEIAKLNVLQIINEPTAAAIAYGFANNSGEQAERTVLVYDLGGGTFDITMIKIAPSKIEVVVTGGDHNLGGKDWDDAIINYLVQQYQEQTGSDEDILLDPETFQDLQLAAEKAKKTLTTRNDTGISFTHGTDRIKVKITKEKFEELTAHLTERTISLTNLMLDEAKKKDVDTFDDILLVGGSTRMPQISEAITKEFGKLPVTFDPDEAVSKGAALFGHQSIIKEEIIRIYNGIVNEDGGAAEALTAGSDTSMADQEKLIEASEEVAKRFHLGGSVRESLNTTIIDVSSKSFGIIAFNEDDVEMVINIIFKNDQVPTEVTQTFLTRVDNQENVEIVIKENEVSDEQIEVDAATEIGTATLDMPYGLPKGAEIDVTFKLNKEGRLEVLAVEKAENRQVTTAIETKSVISGKELEEAIERSNSVKVS
ncbi:Hsp70 family protein [Sutcliffiella halmapala]